MDDPTKKLFEVGDIIESVPKYGKLFFETYKYEAPFTVTEVYLNDRGDQWLLKFRDTNGRRGDTGWYHFRFEPVFVGYDPNQTGDTDDDV